MYEGTRFRPRRDGMAGADGSNPLLLEVAMLRIALAFAIVTLLVGSRGWAEEPQPAGADAAVRGLVKGNASFALDLYARLRGASGNLFVSPFSVSTALTMTYGGARGTTAEQMAATLKLPQPGAPAHDAFAALLAGSRVAAGLRVANGLFGGKGAGFQAEFLDLLRTRYAARLEEVDFSGDSEGARRIINEWVGTETAGRIPELLRQGDLTPATTLVLANAIHFKAAWAGPFDPALTRPAAFTLASGEQVQVPMMGRTGACRTGEEAGTALLELPYAEGARSMLFLVPAAHDGLAALEAALPADALDRWLKRMYDDERQVHVPRFKVDCRFELGGVLQELGMKDAFGAGADFSGMTGKPDLFIGRIVHQAVVEVNEEGTEAAAATAVAMERGAPPPPIRLDRPFLFLIRDTRTGALLFLGRVAAPR